MHPVTRYKLFKIAGWIVSGLATLVILMSATVKLAFAKRSAELFELVLGFAGEVVQPLGVIQIFAAMLYLIPRTALLGAVLLTAYLGGAVAASVRVYEPLAFPIGLGIAFWIGLVLRRPDIWNAAGLPKRTVERPHVGPADSAPERAAA